MRIGFFLSDRGGSPLQVGLERGLQQLGHHVENFNRHAGYDLVLIFNQCAHTTDYRYPEFPKPRVPIAFIDTAEYGYFKRLPGTIGHYATAFHEGSLSHDTKNRQQQERLRGFLEGRSFPYFLREFSKYVEFPAGYHPIDYPLYHFSACQHPPDREEYLRRELELFVSWGASHPWRLNITQALRGCHTRCEVSVIEENGTPRMPQGHYFNRTRAAKTSVSFDGYGSGSFRVTEVLVRCLLLVAPLSIRTREPLVNGVTCVEYEVATQGEEFISTDICAKLRESLADPEGSFKIYERGFHHCNANYTERATADYVLKTVAAHNWKTPTALRL